MSLSERVSLLKNRLHELIEELDTIGQELKMVELNKTMDEVNASAKSIEIKPVSPEGASKVGCETCLWWHPGNRQKQRQCEKFGPVPDEFARNPIGCMEFEDDIPF